MTWLSLIGLSLDGVGAALIAWPILRNPPEAREEGRPRWDGNPWIPVLRRREQSLVQVGAFFLVLGFTLQAAAQVVGLDGRTERTLGVVAAAAILAAGITLGLRRARRGLPRYTTFEGAKRIEDQRHVFQVATVDDWWNLLAGFVRDRSGLAIGEIAERRDARINHGRWVVSCPRCGNDAMGWPENPQTICVGCGIVFGVTYPDQGDMATIERLLLRRPQPNRNWGQPEDSIETLRAENRERGLPDD